MELRIVLFRDRYDQELVSPVVTTLVVGPVGEDGILRSTKSALTSRANQSAHIWQPVSGAPQPESSLPEKQVLASCLRSGIDERWQCAPNWHGRTTVDLRSRRARIRCLLERGEVCAQLIELGKPGYDISRSQRDFGFNQSGLGARRDVDVRFTRWPHQLHKEGAGTKVVVERSRPGLVCIERLARGAATDAHGDTRIVGAEEIQTNEAFAIARHPSTGAVVQRPDLVVAQRLGVEHRELEVVWNCP